MECGLCSKPLSRRRKPSCASCSQASLYGPRVEQVTSLLSREKAHTHVEAIVRPGNDGILAALPEDADWDAITIGIKTNSHERAKADEEATEERIRSIAEKADELKQQIEEYRAMAADQREASERRRKALATERTQLEKRKTKALEPIHLSIRKAKHRLDKVHSRTMEARGYLCKEVSSLSGLKKVRREDGKAAYRLSGLPLPDLRDLNGLNGRVRAENEEFLSGGKYYAEPHELVSTSLDNTCRFLAICCHYLSIRLPAEILLPHNDFPHSAIVPPDSSYRTPIARYPGYGQSPSPEVYRDLLGNELSRPRLLQINRPLSQLQKEDPKSAALFVEGVTLLAYNVAWLCRTQGVDVAPSFDDICALGRNLHQLFPAKDRKARPTLTRNITSATNNTERTTITDTDTRPTFGSHSHGSARHSLSGHEGLALLGAESDWRISVTRLTDQLKSHLRHELQRAEWHIVEDTEWDEVLEVDQPVLVGGARQYSEAKGPAMSVMTIKPSDGADDEDATLGDRAKGRSGWMKVRGRGGDT